MNAQKAEDIKDIALKLEQIRMSHPEDYFTKRLDTLPVVEREWNKQAVQKVFNANGSFPEVEHCLAELMTERLSGQERVMNENDYI